MLEIIGVCAGLAAVIYLAGALATKPVFKVYDSTRAYTVTTVRPSLLRRTGIKTYIVVMLVACMIAAAALGALLAMIF